MKPGYPYPDPGQSEHFIALLEKLHRTLTLAMMEADQAIGEGAHPGERVSQIFYAIGMAANALASASVKDDPEQQANARSTALTIMAQAMARPINLIWVDKLPETGVFVKPRTPDH